MQEISHATTYDSFSKVWSDDPRFEALERKDRESLLNDRFVDFFLYYWLIWSLCSPWKNFCSSNDCLRCVLDQCMQPLVVCLVFGMVMHCYMSLHSFIQTIPCLGPDDVSGSQLEHVITMVHFGSKSDFGSIHLLRQSSTGLEYCPLDLGPEFTVAHLAVLLNV